MLHNEPLDGKSQNGQANEPRVVEEGRKDVEFFVAKLASVDLVEQLHKDEGLEYESVVFNLDSWLVERIWILSYG